MNVLHSAVLTKLTGVTTTLLIAVQLLVPMTAKAESCLDVLGAAAGGAANFLVGVDCEELVESDLLTDPRLGQHRIFFATEALLTNNEDDLRYLRATRLAIRDAIATLRRTPGINFNETLNTRTVVGIEQANSPDEGFVAGVGPFEFLPYLPATCPIYVNFLRVSSYPIHEIKQAIAHEVFHCYQHLIYSSGDGWDFDKNDNDQWWIEGMANFFSHVVYPTANMEFHFVDEFDPWLPVYKHLPGRPAYTTSAFFQALEQYGMGRQVFTEMQRVPRNVRSEDHQLWLSRWQDIPTNFMLFATDIQDGRLLESTRIPMPVPVRAPVSVRTEFEADVETIVQLTAPAFVAKAHVITLDPGFKYLFEVQEEGARGEYRARFGDLQWEPLPESFEVDCENEVRLMIMPTSTAGPEEESREKYTLDISITPKERSDCGCAYAPLSTIERGALGEPMVCGSEALPLDQCLVGTWVLEDDSYRQQVERLLTFRGSSLVAASMSWRVTVSDDGAFESCTHGQANVKIEPRRSGGPEGFIVTTMSGTSAGKIGQAGFGKMCGQEVRNDLFVRTQGQIGPVPIDQTMPMGPSPFTVDSSYRCTEETLSITTDPEGVDPVTHRYRRD